MKREGGIVLLIISGRDATIERARSQISAVATLGDLAYDATAGLFRGGRAEQAQTATLTSMIGTP
jgi:hypothetical protein